MRYLSGAPYKPLFDWEHGGFMAQPGHSNRPETCDDITWAADNGCYAAGDAFDARHWLRWLERRSGRGHCLFAVLPDVPFSHEATMERSMAHIPAVRQFGYVPALAIQNGATVEHVPWDDLGAVFIAGDKRFKTSPSAWAICREATRRGLHIHIARRNSKRAMQSAYDMGADSIDGTFLKYAPDTNWQRMQRWFAEFCPHGELAPAWGADRRFMRCLTCGRDIWKVA